MKLVIILFFCLSGISWSKENNTQINLAYTNNPSSNHQSAIHYPILGDRATTVGHLKINFDKMPGGQVGDSVIMNAISVGLGERVEFGFIPWVYAFDQSDFFQYGMVLKYNFYKSKTFQIAAGVSQIKGLLEQSENQVNENGSFNYSTAYHQWWNYSFISLNYTPIGERYNFGITVKYTEVKSSTSVRGVYDYKNAETGFAIEYPVNQYKTDSTYQDTITLDMNYLVKSYHWIGLSLGTASLNSKLNMDEEMDEEIGNSSKKRYVLGTSYIHRNKIWLLQDPRISVSYFEGHGLNYGFSSTF